MRLQERRLSRAHCKLTFWMRERTSFGHLGFTILKEAKMVYFEIKWRSELSDPL